MLQFLAQFLLPTLLIVAALIDVLSFRIPNWLTLLIALAFFPMAWATSMPAAEFSHHVMTGFSLFAIGFILFQFGAFGGGDAKLMAAAGLWFGFPKTLPFLAMTAIAGGGLAIIFVLAAAIRRPAQAGQARGPKLLRPKIPYGLAFAIGGLLAFKGTWWMAGVA